MNEIAAKYEVKFINHYYEDGAPLEIRFIADSPKDVKAVVTALSAFYSGDPYECFINGEKAVLESDWGLI